jgi:hypothetical protein
MVKKQDYFEKIQVYLPKITYEKFLKEMERNGFYSISDFGRFLIIRSLYQIAEKEKQNKHDEV